MKTNQNNLRKLNDEALCHLCDALGSQIWTCRRRGWIRKIGQLSSQLGRATTELGRRIKRDEARRNRA